MPALKSFTTLLFCVSLLSCDVGQGIKTLGTKAVGGKGSSGTDSDSFSITLAYRDSVTDATTPIRSVSLQGIRGVPSANLVNECGATGSLCVCEFYRSTTDASPVTSSSVGISQQNNSFNCVIPAAITDAQLRLSTAPASKIYVKLKRNDVTTRNTGLIELKSTLVIEDVLGSTLSKTKVRGIFNYKCNRTFFEGEGVNPSQVTCVPGQKLGVLGASYDFYTFRSGEDSNNGGGDTAFPDDICKRNNFLKIQCNGTGTQALKYGFYKDSVEPFVVGVTMTRAPEGENLSAIYGYAALPDSAGNCPTGLIKVRPWVAQPASIVADSLGDSNPPSSFVNADNKLNNTVVEAVQPTTNFIVTRQKNQTACSGVDGSCVSATFAGSSQAQSVAYVGLTPVLCAIPTNLMSGLF